MSPPRVLFITGKLAEPSLRRTLAELAPRGGFEPHIAVLPITVAALMTTNWVSRHLPPLPEQIQRVILPGFCRGEVEEVSRAAGAPAERGPADLRDLPEFFGKKARPVDYGRYDIEILAEINHAPRKPLETILREARRYRASGSDLIDLGCDPGPTWDGVGAAVRALRADGFRVSIDSFNPDEVTAALNEGAELVLSVNGTNLEHARRWHVQFPDVEVVAIPDTPDDLDSLSQTVGALREIGIRHRLDPILEPIGFGFAASLGRYIETRRRFPDAEMMMGVGNLTELTDSDSAGLNVVLAGFCQELGIRSVLATEVINWARSAVKEFDLARRLVFHAVREKVLPKRLESNLVLLRDPKLYEQGAEVLEELARRVTDRNYRIFAERGELHVLNGSVYLRGTDPFEVFERLAAADSKLDVPHAFYLGYEFAKAITALTLGKNYTQDQALRWGFLTIPETPHREQSKPT
ncbi:Pterin binding enzyme [Gemmata obscuriglobus]|uniref:Dihydropteroate synthase n=1 Tax=Gemmata obscuriglobus TaxID=114 RepID=A0A2Z3H4S2_9BACT